MQVKDNLVELEVVYSKLNKALDENISRLNAGATAVDNYNKKISVVPSEFQKGLQQIKLTIDEVKNSNIQLTKAEKESANAIIKTNQVIRSDIATRKAQNAEIEKTEKALAREQAKLQASENLYNKVQTKLNSLSNEYKNLATKKELGLSLTAKEEQRYASLQTRIQNYDKTLKAVDGTMGKYQRNVGNYAGAFNPLSNSINQLTREMPAFTYSVQTGFMALSNNIPIFTDAIGNAIAQNKELVAQGKPTTSVLKQLAGALFSWQTLLGVGITLLTVYGKEIGEFFKNISKAGVGIKSLEEQQSQLNKALRDGGANASEEVAKLDILYRKTIDVSLSINQRKKAVDELQELYPKYFKNLKDETILNGQAEKSYLDVRDAILSKYMADAIGKQMQQNAQERIKDEFNLIKDIAYLKEKIERDYTKTYLNEAGERVKVIDEYYGELSSANLKLKAIRDATKKDDDLLFKMQSQYLEKSKLLIIEETKVTKKKTEAKKKDADVEEMVNSSSLKALENTISKLKEAYITATIGSVRYELLGGQIKLLEEIYNGLTKSVNASNEAIDDGSGIALDLGGSEFITDEDGDRLMEEGDKLRELLKEFKQGFIDDFADQSGFGKFLDILGGGLDKFEGDAVATALAVTDAFQEAFNTINELSNQSFENEYLNLEKRKETALMFAGDSATAQSEIERQAEEQRKQIAEREFKAKKKQALFNIAIDTAQAVMAQLASTPLPLGSGFVLTILGLGALQAGVVANRELPQYWTGTDNAKEGFALTQERGREIIMDRFGKIKDLGSDDGARLTKMKAGDKVLNNEKTMELLMFNSQFNSKLAPNLNTMPNLVVNNNTDFTPIIKAIQNKPETILNFDNGEFKKFVRNGNSIKETTQIRNGFKGLRV